MLDRTVQDHEKDASGRQEVHGHIKKAVYEKNDQKAQDHGEDGRILAALVGRENFLPQTDTVAEQKKGPHDPIGCQRVQINIMGMRRLMGMKTFIHMSIRLRSEPEQRKHGKEKPCRIPYFYPGIQSGHLIVARNKFRIEQHNHENDRLGDQRSDEPPFLFVRPEKDREDKDKGQQRGPASCQQHHEKVETGCYDVVNAKRHFFCAHEFIKTENHHKFDDRGIEIGIHEGGIDPVFRPVLDHEVEKFISASHGHLVEFIQAVCGAKPRQSNDLR